jgi:hypothetical protein
LRDMKRAMDGQTGLACLTHWPKNCCGLAIRTIARGCGSPRSEFSRLA